jgi:alkanesulfonate monooxygenase SsuD/methylene tetrahydromethanopterin reductase-like flavin-dependent oxidoreductase (luciferase family)
MHLDMVIDPFGIDATAAVGAAVAAERAGFSSVWTYDHLSGAIMGAESALDVWTTLGAIAASTERIGVGPLVANVVTRHPAVTAVAAATLGQLAPERVTVGVGAGAGPGSRFGSELDMVGIERQPDSVRRSMVAEAIAMMRSIWRGDLDYPGEHFQLRDASGFLTVPAPPIIVGCNGPKMAAVAGQHADGANFHGWEDNLPALIAAATRAAGERSLEISVEAPREAAWADWLAPAGPQRTDLERLGVDRLMVVWKHTDGIESIAAAARYF